MCQEFCIGVVPVEREGDVVDAYLQMIDGGHLRPLDRHFETGEYEPAVRCDEPESGIDTGQPPGVVHGSFEVDVGVEFPADLQHLVRNQKWLKATVSPIPGADVTCDVVL